MNVDLSDDGFEIVGAAPTGKEDTLAKARNRGSPVEIAWLAAGASIQMRSSSLALDSGMRKKPSAFLRASYINSQGAPL